MRVLSKLPGVRLDLHSDRLAGVVFELLCNGSVIKFAVASYYGCAGDRGALSSALANGLAWSWNDAFESGGLLPATRTSGRRLDFGLGCGLHFPSSAAQHWSFSDHAQVVYEVDLQEPGGHRGPSFQPLASTPVSEQCWADAWDAAAFCQAHDLDAAWTLLSDVAERRLTKGEVTGHRRSQPWRPRPFVHERSRAGKVLVEVRVSQLRHRPRDSHLRSKIGKQTSALLPSCAVAWRASLL